MEPLSEILRPQTLQHVAGQEHLVKQLEKLVAQQTPLSLLFYGPPGCGKTTLARLYAKSFSLAFTILSAVF